jgi:anaerobic magnesium-protoporphyrin IX monomethyl ester cyclase
MKFLLIQAGSREKREKLLTLATSPPLGLLYLGAILEKDGHEVEVLDYHMEDLSKEKLKNAMASSDAVGMTIYTFDQKAAEDISKTIKELDSDIPFLIGGPHCIFNQKKSLSDFPQADICVAGEGEDVILDLVKYLQGQKKLEDINGVYYKENGSIKSGKPIQIIENLDKVPFPARHLVEKYEYGDLPFGYHMKKMTAMLTSRGCPFNCRFCSRYDTIIPGFKFRQRSAENVLQELVEISEKYKSINIVDENFLVDKKRAHKIFDELNKMGKELEIGIHGARVDAADKDLYKKMKKAGVKYLYFGLESGNQDVLDFYHKRTTLPQIKNAIKLSKKFNFITIGNFILGAPIETKEHLERTIKFACSLPLDIAGFGPLIYIKGSQLWDEAVKSKKITEDVSLIFAGSEDGLGKLSREEIFKYINLGYKRFYYRPSYLLGQMYRGVTRNDYSLLMHGLRFLFMLKGRMTTAR